ncbi:hypothetical protein F7Q99_27785 [Streptomyces kaniharaensis]|uniref:Uncharacterized protein n=1 Tax=Streptomyces kaniharaensis TaxID=212423 RepID=A0A6N7L2E9_9ACTN|nr:hypothetical protein [Streptomyces kaniharaensis]MQS15953.1 hypothetical protein [Streptomyces kaniharaensis]
MARLQAEGLVEVDREKEGVGTLVEKLTSYRTWCELPAKGTAKAVFEASLRRRGARTHGLRLWPTVYPPTGREGLPPVALVLEAGRKRTRPGAKRLHPGAEGGEGQAGPRAPAEPHDRGRGRLRGHLARPRVRRRRRPRPRPPPGAAGGGHHPAAAAPSRGRRPGVAPVRSPRLAHPHDALANPDGDELLAVERAEADRARRAREAAERERRRPACRCCLARFSDERWEEKERGWNDDGLCAGCRQADADRKAREAAERERAAAEAAAAEAKRTSSWWRRS